MPLKLLEKLPLCQQLAGAGPHALCVLMCDHGIHSQPLVLDRDTSQPSS